MNLLPLVIVLVLIAMVLVLIEEGGSGSQRCESETGIVSLINCPKY